MLCDGGEGGGVLACDRVKECVCVCVCVVEKPCRKSQGEGC